MVVYAIKSHGDDGLMLNDDDRFVQLTQMIWISHHRYFKTEDSLQLQAHWMLETTTHDRVVFHFAVTKCVSH